LEIFDTKLKKLSLCEWTKIDEQENPELLTEKILNRMEQNMSEFQSLLYLFLKVSHHGYWFEEAKTMEAYRYHWERLSHLLDFSIQNFARSEDLNTNKSEAYPDIYPVPCKFGGESIKEVNVDETKKL
jgi:hypothetical protein